MIIFVSSFTMEMAMSSFRLLSDSNPKLAKGFDYGWATYILHLSPSNLSGHNVCAMATPGCRAACLNTAGRGAVIAGKTVREWDVDDLKNGKITSRLHAARMRKTNYFFDNPDGFLADLV